MILSRHAWAGVLGALVAGCGFVTPAANPIIAGSQWRVTAVDDEPITGTEVIITILADSVTVSTSCGASSGEIEQNEADRFAVADLQGPDNRPLCPPAAQRTHDLVAEALSTVDHWAIDGNSTELRGERTIRVEPQHTDS